MFDEQTTDSQTNLCGLYMIVTRIIISFVWDIILFVLFVSCIRICDYLQVLWLHALTYLTFPTVMLFTVIVYRIDVYTVLIRILFYYQIIKKLNLWLTSPREHTGQLDFRTRQAD